MYIVKNDNLKENLKTNLTITKYKTYTGYKIGIQKSTAFLFTSQKAYNFKRRELSQCHQKLYCTDINVKRLFKNLRRTLLLNDRKKEHPI